MTADIGYEHYSLSQGRIGAAGFGKRPSDTHSSDHRDAATRPARVAASRHPNPRCGGAQDGRRHASGVRCMAAAKAVVTTGADHLGSRRGGRAVYGNGGLVDDVGRQSLRGFWSSRDRFEFGVVPVALVRRQHDQHPTRDAVEAGARHGRPGPSLPSPHWLQGAIARS